jgi:drug/metabolite transporter (DMT)-like permease
MKNPYIKFMLATLIFGSNGIVASHIPMSSYEIVLCRTVIGGLFLSCIALLRHESFSFRENKFQMGWLLLSGLALSGNWMFLYEAYQQIGVSLATLACYCGPVLVMILSYFIFHESFTIPKVLGFIMVTIGVICVNGTDFEAQGLSWGLACGLLSAVCFAILVIAVKKTKGLSGLMSSASQLIIASIVVGIFTAVSHSGPVVLTAESIAAILIIGLINTGLGCYLYFSGVQELSAQSVSICGYIEPLSALILAAIFLGETLTGMQLAGAALILGGVGIGEIIRKRPTKSSSAN